MSKNEKGSDGYRKFGFMDKAAYAAGDFGCNAAFVLTGTFFTIFYTQYIGISSLTFAALLVAMKVWDAINDIIIGAMMDSTKHQFKNGKFKGFIGIGASGLVFSMLFMFLPIPNAPQVVKLLVSFFGYAVFSVFYTIINVPYGSMLSVITTNPGERAQLSAWRSIGSMLAAMPINIILPLIVYDENKNLIGGRMIWVALVLGLVAIAAFQFLIRNTVQRVETPVAAPDAPKFNWVKALKNFAHNRAAIGATLAPVSMFLGSVGAAAAMTVMFQAYFQNVKISGVMGLLTTLPMLLFMPFLKKIVDKWGKKEAASFGALFSIVATAAMLILPVPPNGQGIMIMIICQFLNGIGIGMYMCVGNAMMADAIDYNEWKNGIREEGVIYAIHSFFRKLAQGIGPSIGLVLMVALGYNEKLGAAQPFEVALNMRYLVAAEYLFSAVLMWIGIRFIYNLDKKTLATMQSELEARRNTAGSGQ